MNTIISIVFTKINHEGKNTKDRKKHGRFTVTEHKGKAQTCTLKLLQLLAKQNWSWFISRIIIVISDLCLIVIKQSQMC